MRDDLEETSLEKPVIDWYIARDGQQFVLLSEPEMQRLKRSRQYWIATTRPDGTRHLMIIWGLWFDDSFWFSTGARSRKARNLAANPKCVIATDDAAKAVILEGTVEVIDFKHPNFEKFAKAYEKKYDWDVRGMAQGLYRLQPSIGFGFFEKKFEETATRWDFR